MMSIGQGQIIGSVTMPSSGYIYDPSRMAILLLQSSFESCSILNLGGGEYSISGLKDVTGTSISNVAGLTGSGSSIWIENGTLCNPHSGLYCLGLRSDKALAYGVRSSEALTHLNGLNPWPQNKALNITGDFYVSIWLYFPADWSIPTSDPVEHYSPNWYEMLNPFMLSDTDAFNPKSDVHIHRRLNGDYYLEFQFEQGNQHGMMTWVMIDPWDISTILGRWTHWAYFIHRTTDSTQAYVTIWLNDQMVGNCTDYNPTTRDSGIHLYTMNRNGNNIWSSFFAKSYLDGDGVNYHYVWADDLEVWDGIP